MQHYNACPICIVIEVIVVDYLCHATAILPQTPEEEGTAFVALACAAIKLPKEFPP